MIVNCCLSARLQMLGDSVVEGGRCTSDVELSAYRTCSLVNNISGVTQIRILDGAGWSIALLVAFILVQLVKQGWS